MCVSRAKQPFQPEWLVLCVVAVEENVSHAMCRCRVCCAQTRTLAHALSPIRVANILAQVGMNKCIGRPPLLIAGWV